MQAEEPRRIPLVYVGAEDHPALQATTFGIVNDPAHDEFVLTMGQLQLPLLVGDDEDKRRQVDQISFVAIKVIGRYSMTRSRVEELVEMLQTNLRREPERSE